MQNPVRSSVLASVFVAGLWFFSGATAQAAIDVTCTGNDCLKQGWRQTDQQSGADKFAPFTYMHSDAQNPVCGTAHNVASAEMLYVSGSSGGQFDERARRLRGCEDIVSAIVTASSDDPALAAALSVLTESPIDSQASAAFDPYAAKQTVAQ